MGQYTFRVMFSQAWVMSDYLYFEVLRSCVTYLTSWQIQVCCNLYASLFGLSLLEISPFLDALLWSTCQSIEFTMFSKCIPSYSLLVIHKFLTSSLLVFVKLFLFFWISSSRSWKTDSCVLHGVDQVLIVFLYCGFGRIELSNYKHNCTRDAECVYVKAVPARVLCSVHCSCDNKTSRLVQFGADELPVPILFTCETDHSIEAVCWLTLFAFLSLFQWAVMVWPTWSLVLAACTCLCSLDWGMVCVVCFHWSYL